LRGLGPATQVKLEYLRFTSQSDFFLRFFQRVTTSSICTYAPIRRSVRAHKFLKTVTTI